MLAQVPSTVSQDYKPERPIAYQSWAICHGLSEEYRLKEMSQETSKMLEMDSLIKTG